jgi:uncharacterized membrane protein YheB (UPF0754 family)
MPTLLVVILIPLVSALIGWLTNRVAIHMLFHPRHRVGIAGLRVQGLIPRRQPELAGQAADIVEGELVNGRVVQELIAHVDLEPHLEASARRLVRNRVASRLSAMPLVGSFINEPLLEKLEQIVATEMKNEAAVLLDRVAEDVGTRLQVREIVQNKVAGFDLDKLEQVVLKIASKEFKLIEALGAILGLLVGLAQVILLSIAGML